VGLHQVGKDINGILATNTPGHMHSQAFPGVFVDDHHQLDRAASQVICPYVISEAGLVCPDFKSFGKGADNSQMASSH